MRRQVALLSIGLLVMLAVLTQPRTQDALASSTDANTLRADSVQNQLPPPGDVSVFLSGPNAGEPAEIVISYLQQNSAKVGIAPADLNDVLLKDRYVTGHNGVTHIYLRQRFKGIELHNGDINANVSSQGEIISVGNRFVKNLALYANTDTPEISPGAAVALAAEQMQWSVTAPLELIENPDGPDQQALLSSGGISNQPIPVKLLYVRLADSDVRLTWNAIIRRTEGPHTWFLAIDALTGKIVLKQDMILHENGALAHLQAGEVNLPAARPETALESASRQPDSPLVTPSYFVFALPLEHPLDGPGLPDSQTTVVDEEDDTASPFGWHDVNASEGHEFIDTRGNNVSAQEDRDGDNAGGIRPTGIDPDRLNFHYPFDPAQGPTTGDNPNAAIVNLFYANNVIHDIFYHYGFDEVSGNFQENNYDRGGLGADPVYADVQDGLDFGALNNAFFEVTPDGIPPHMGMYVWDFAEPDRDSSLDNGIIIHEYGHGISSRLVGGPSAPECVFNFETMGEGWSDFFALALTVKEGDTGDQPRGIGTYVLGQPPDGPGIRRLPYTTDMTINPQTYDWLRSSFDTHEVGEIWAAMVWDMYWALVDQYGYDPDLYQGTGGNNLALRLIIDGMKFTACNPGFVDARDGILAADLVNNGGANQCTIWGAFARRGLGYSADQGSPFDIFDGTEAFDVPPACRDDLSLTKTSTPPVIEAGKVLTYVITAANYTSVTVTGLVLTDPIPEGTTYVPGSASDGGSESGGVITWNLPDLAPDEVATRSFQVTVARDFPEAQVIFSDTVESGGDNWIATDLWHIQDDAEPCGNSFSPTHSWYYGQASDCLYPDNALGQLTTAAPVALPAGTPVLKFMGWHQLEPCCDQGRILVSTDGVDFTPIWVTTGSPSAWQEQSVDLSAYAGQSAWLRFEFVSDFSVIFGGWYVDDIQIVAEPAVVNTATLASNEGLSASATTATKVEKHPDIAVTPSALETTLRIGAQASSVITIANSGTAPLSFRISLRDEITPGSAEPAALMAAQQAPVTVQVPGYQPEKPSGATYAGARLAERQEALYEPKVGALAGDGGASTLLLAAADVTQMQSLLSAYSDIGPVDVFDARWGTPTLDYLLGYKTVVVISNEPFFFAAAVGDVLADYVDNQGKVVQTTPTFFDAFGDGWGLAGRWVTDGYSPFIGTGDWFSDASLGDFDATHPIMQGVDGATDFFRQMVDLAPGAALVASWSDDEFVATTDNVVALNTFIPDGSLWTGDIDLIVHNSIIWLQDQSNTSIAWVSADPVSGTVASDTAQTVMVNFDANFPGVTGGDYSALMQIRSNDPDEAVVTLPITMHVIGPKLSISSTVPAWFGRSAEVAVVYDSAAFDIAATSFSVDYDESCLSFDPTDADLNGIPDAITFATSPELQATVSADVGDSDGELDFFVADMTLPLSRLVDGVLATIRFTPICLPPGNESLGVTVGFSNAPKASFSDFNGVSIPATTVPGSIEVTPGTPGDCNHDGVVDSADAISCLLELFDGDGAFWLDAPGGTFAGNPQGCDSNLDAQIDSADLICTVLIIFQGQGACAVPTANAIKSVSAASAPALTIANAVAAQPGESLAVPITFASNGSQVAATAFVLTYDASRLHFDPTDGNGDGIPDAVNLHVPARFAKRVALDGEGRIQIALSDMAVPLMTLADGPLATITFTVAMAAEGESAAISFADDYPVSVGGINGASLPVITENGSVLIDGTETSNQPSAPKEFLDDTFLPIAPK